MTWSTFKRIWWPLPCCLRSIILKLTIPLSSSCLWSLSFSTLIYIYISSLIVSFRHDVKTGWNGSLVRGYIHIVVVIRVFSSLPITSISRKRSIATNTPIFTFNPIFVLFMGCCSFLNFLWLMPHIFSLF